MGLFPVAGTLGLHQDTSLTGAEMVQSGITGKEGPQFLSGMGKDRDEETGERYQDPPFPDSV